MPVTLRGCYGLFETLVPFFVVARLEINAGERNCRNQKPVASFVNLIIGCFVLNNLSHAVFVNNIQMIDSETSKKKKESGMKGKGKHTTSTGLVSTSSVETGNQGLLSSQDR